MGPSPAAGERGGEGPAPRAGSGTCDLGLIREDLAAHTGREDDDRWAGAQVPLRLSGLYEKEGRTWDHGWSVAVPVGYGGILDDWIAGWVPLCGGFGDIQAREES